MERRFEDGTRIATVDHADGATEVLLEAEGKKVSWAFIVPMLMRVGAAVVRMDGIGGVRTDDAHRYRGYSRRVLEACVDVMRAGDAAISTLYGIPDFYPKYGYATTGPDYSIQLELRGDDAAVLPAGWRFRSLELRGDDPAVLPAGWRFRPFAAGDQATIAAIYHANTRRAVGPLVRHETGDEPPGNEALMTASPSAKLVSGRAWRRLEQLIIEPGEDACRVLVDEVGTIVAYAWVNRGGWWIDSRYGHDPGAFHLGEVMAANPAAADAVLIGLRRWAAERMEDIAKIELAMPPIGPVAMAAADEGGVFLARHTRRGEFMGRVLDTERLLRQLQPELSERVRAARVDSQGRLSIRTEEGEASLAVTPEGVAVDGDSGGPELVVEMSETVLARLSLGAFETGDLLGRLPERPSEDAARLLEVLFPRRTPHIYAIDRF